MLTITMTKGLPGSGKSTWVKDQVDKNPGMYKRINKDDLRSMLDNSKFSKDNEKFIIKARDLLTIATLSAGKHVIIDDTNLDPKHDLHIRALILVIKEKIGDVKFIIKDFTDVPLETCIERDLKRASSVGEAVIMKMYNKHLKPKNEVINRIDGLPNIIICDLDGTLALLNGRNPYDASTCEDDILNPVVAELLIGRDVVLLSGREDKYKEQTIKFLDKHNIKYRDLIMRKSGDSRKDSIIKKEIFDTNIRDKFNVDFILDDRNQVVEMWRSIGLTCLQVAEGNF